MHRAVDRPPVPAAGGCQTCQAWRQRRAVSTPLTISLVNLGGARDRPRFAGRGGFLTDTWGKSDRSPEAQRLAVTQIPMRNKLYFILMALCLGLFISAWAVVRLYSVTAAVVMTVVAVAIPPIAVIIANAGDEATRRR